MSELKLLPCPFCEDGTLAVECFPNEHGRKHIECYDCGTTGPCAPTEEASVEAWNSRPVDDRLRELRERLKAEQQDAYERQQDAAGKIKQHKHDKDNRVPAEEEYEWCEGRIQGFNSALDAINELFPNSEAETQEPPEEPPSDSQNDEKKGF